MKNISVTIDKHSKYSIDLKDEYQVDEFISFFENQINKVKMIASGSAGIVSKEEIKIFRSNILFDRLDTMVKGLGNDIHTKDNTTMRTYSSVIKSTDKRRGLVWLKPVSNSLVIHLRPVDYKSIDKKNKIIYSVPGKSTFGNLPVMTINDPSELEYAFKVVKHAYGL